MHMHDGSQWLERIRGLAGAIAVVAVAGGGGGGCSGGDDGAMTPDGGASETPDGDPFDPGGGGPALLELTCPPLAMPPVAGTVFVDGAAAAGGDGSKTAPVRTVGEALTSASRGDVIYVVAGTYQESLRITDLDLVVYGGFEPGFGDRTDGCATVLEAPNRSQNVLEADLDVRQFGLDGVTVQKGARGLVALADGEVDPMYTIASSVFEDNGTVTEVGGGALLDNASATITMSVFRDNRAAKGAAIALGGEGGATIAIERSLFERNIGHSDHAGGLYLNPTTGSITRSTFRGNEIGRDTGYGWGGAIVVYKGPNPASLDLSYNVFTDNLASVGGAVFIDDGATATMSHDLLYRNRSIRENGIARGAALYVDGLGGPGTGSHLVADHLTVANNNYGEDGAISPARGGDVYLETYSSATFTNSLFWNNGEEPLFGDPTCSIAVSYSITATACDGTSACTIGAGVLAPAAVHFVDEAADDYHEKSTAGHYSGGAWVVDDVSSPAIDAADPAASTANEPAPNGTRANLGAFGQTGEASKSP
jgi:hypothetical protein